MKKHLLQITCILLCFCMLFAVTACKGNEAEKKGKKPDKTTASSDDTSDVGDSTDITADDFEMEDFVIEDEDAEPAKPKRNFTVNGTPRAYVTTVNSSVKFRRQPESSVTVYNKANLDRSKGTVIEIDPNTTYQTIDGFGASLTGSACNNIWAMPESLRTDLMTKLFDPQNGIGLSFLRQPVGSSDFSLDYYSYDDVPEGQEDWNLSNFSIDADRQQILPLVKWAQGLNSNMKVIAAVWSPPCWMKTTYGWQSFNKENSTANNLRIECYDVFSKYLIQYLKAYQAEGVPIYALSPANEPFTSVQYPGTKYSADQMMRLVKYYLRSAMDDAGLKTKLICYDESWNLQKSLDYYGKQFGTSDIVAYHFYGGDASVMKSVHEMFPETPLYITEAAGMYQSQQQQLFRQIKNMTESFRNYASSWILWNITLDQNYGPLKNGDVMNSQKGTGLTEYNTETGKLSYQMDFYALAHFSKFIQPGAVVVDSTDVSIKSEEDYYNTVAMNENGTITVVIGNQSYEPETFKMVIGNKVVEFTVPAESVATLNWDANC